MVKKPDAQTSFAEKELEKVENQLNKFESEVKEMTLDRMNMSPKQETEPQTNISQKDMERKKDIYLKPIRSIGSKEKFNEDYRKEYEFQKEYVQFIAENKEIIGEELDFWTKPFAGMPAEEWKVPVNKPVWAPRYVAENIHKCSYHRLKMDQSVSTGTDGRGSQFYGAMAVDTTVQRLDATPVSSRRSVFMGANNF